MKSGSLKSSLLKLMILVPLTLDNIVQSAVNGENHHRSGRRMNLTHAVKMSQKFVCKEPQSRAYNLRDLMRDVQQNSGESPVKPVYVVLKRCDGHSGCCMSPDMSCSPEPSAIYYDEIEIEVSSLIRRTTIPRWIRVEQHGRCFCDVTTINDRYQQELQWPNFREELQYWYVIRANKGIALSGSWYDGTSRCMALGETYEKFRYF